ncbi:MAG: tetratricopeptide repeat protein [Pseudomonadota bacterium]
MNKKAVRYTNQSVYKLLSIGFLSIVISGCATLGMESVEVPPSYEANRSISQSVPPAHSLKRSKGKSKSSNSEQKIDAEDVKGSEVDVKRLEIEAANFYQAGNYVQARAHYENILSAQPKNTEVAYRLGNIAFREGRWQDAQNFYQQVIAQDPNHSRAQYNLAMTHLSLSEQHLKYYAATAAPDADLTLVNKLMAFLSSLSSDSASAAPAQSDSARSLLNRLQTPSP